MPTQNVILGFLLLVSNYFIIKFYTAVWRVDTPPAVQPELVGFQREQQGGRRAQRQDVLEQGEKQGPAEQLDQAIREIKLALEVEHKHHLHILTQRNNSKLAWQRAKLEREIETLATRKAKEENFAWTLAWNSRIASTKGTTPRSSFPPKLTPKPPHKSLTNPSTSLIPLYTQLSTSIQKLAHHLHNHLHTTPLSASQLHTLSTASPLTHNTPSSHWTNHRPLLLQATLWTHLSNTILSHPLAVFGPHAMSLAQTWPPHAPQNPTSRLSLQSTLAHLLDRTGLAALLDNTSALHTTLSQPHAPAALHTDSSEIPPPHNENASQHPRGNLSSVDAVARADVDYARAWFVASLEGFCGGVGARGRFTAVVEEVVTLAQMFALRAGVCGGELFVHVPERGEEFTVERLGGRVPVGRALVCEGVERGWIGFTVRPGLVVRVGGEEGGFWGVVAAEVFVEEGEGRR